MKRRPHNQNEVQSLAIWMQHHILRAIYQVKKWGDGEIAFHGGTSLKFMHGSPRFSEDLDFMVNPDISLKPLMDSVYAKLNVLIKNTFGAESALRVKMRSEEKNPLLYKFTLERANRLINIDVKVEFFATSAVRDYEVTFKSAKPSTKYVDDIELVAGEFSLPVGTVPQIFWDKLYAIVYRPYIKKRDLYDICWLQQYPSCPSPNKGDLKDAIALLDSIYGNDTDIDEFLQKLEAKRQVFLGEEFQDEYREEMKKWLPANVIDSDVVEKTLSDSADILDKWVRVNQMKMGIR